MYITYNKPKISVVIGTYNRLNLLILCIESIREELSNIDYEIIVVDGGSNDGTVSWLVEQKDIIFILQHNRGVWKDKKIERKPWAYFMNIAFKAAKGKYVCMLSDDSLIISNSILNGLDLFEKELNRGRKIGAVAFYFRDFPVRKQYAVAVNLGNLYVNHGIYLNSAISEVGYCDENYYFYFSDTDLSLKLKYHGYEIIESKKSFVEHYFDATPELRNENNDDRKEKDRIRLIEKWFGVAYPADKKESYLNIIGYWKNHEEGFFDSNKTIDKLIKANDSLKG